MSSDTPCVLVIGAKETSSTIHSQVTKMGFNAFFCKTLEDGWDQNSLATSFDIVIYDVPYPSEDFKDIGKIRNHANRNINSVPIIALSVDDHIDTMELVIKAGADLFTQKMKSSRFLYIEIMSLVRMARRLKE